MVSRVSVNSIFMVVGDVDGVTVEGLIVGVIDGLVVGTEVTKLTHTYKIGCNLFNIAKTFQKINCFMTQTCVCMVINHVFCSFLNIKNLRN